MKRLNLIFIVAISILGLQDARAQDGGETSITLEAYLERVREHGPQLAQQRAESEVIRADLLEAKVLPNPSVEFETKQRARGADVVDGGEYEVVLEQPLLLFGQRSSRIKLAELEVEAAELELEASRVELLNDARQAFVELLVAQEKVSLSEQVLEHAERARQMVAERVEEGAQSRYDLLRMELEEAEVLAEHYQTLAEARQAQLEVAKFITKPGEARRAVWVAEGELDSGEATDEPSWEAVRAEHPMLRSAERALKSADAAIDLARAERWPELEVGLGGLFTVDESSFNIIASIGMELPFFDRGQAEIARAQASAIAAQRIMELHETELRAEFEQALVEVQARQEALDTFRERTRGHLPRLQRMAEESYAEGQSGIPELLDAMHTINTLQGVELELLAELYRARVELDAAMGRAK